jgi:hypothetical protein
MKAKEFKMWRCSECNQVFTGKADADECCLPVVEVGQVWRGPNLTAVVYHTDSCSLVYYVWHQHELPNWATTGYDTLPDFVGKFQTLVKG